MTPAEAHTEIKHLKAVRAATEAQSVIEKHRSEASRRELHDLRQQQAENATDVPVTLLALALVQRLESLLTMMTALNNALGNKGSVGHA